MAWRAVLGEQLAQILSLYSARPDGIALVSELEGALPVRFGVSEGGHEP